MSQPQPDAEDTVHSVAFGPNGVEVTYQEAQDLGEDEAVRTIILRSARYDLAVDDLLTSIREMIDVYAEHRHDAMRQRRRGSPGRPDPEADADEDEG